MQVVKEFVTRTLGLTVSGEVEPVCGGHLNLSYKVATDDGVIFIRTRAPGPLSESSSIASEFAILQHLYSRIPLAEPLRTDGHFMAMRWVAGESDPKRLLSLADENNMGDKIVHAIGAALAQLHLAPVPIANNAIRSFPLSTRWREMSEALHHLPDSYPVLEWAMEKLEERAPAKRDMVLCHRDFRNGNMLIDPETGRVVALIDWELAGLSEAEEDLGWFCARVWRYGNVGKEAGGIGTRDAFYAGYRDVTGMAVDHERVRYWENVAALRWAVIALLQGERHRLGFVNDLDLALTPLRALEAAYDLIMDLDDD